jgi:hypothetical protein
VFVRCDDVFLGDVLMLHVEASSYPNSGITQRKKKKKILLHVQTRRCMHLLYATTNQKHVDVVEEEKEKRCDQGTECRGCYYIVLTAKEALGMQNTIK